MEKITCLKQVVTHIVPVTASVSERKTRWEKVGMATLSLRIRRFQNVRIDKEKAPLLNCRDLHRLSQLCLDWENMFFPLNFLMKWPVVKVCFLKAIFGFTHVEFQSLHFGAGDLHSGQLCEVYGWAAGWKGDHIASKLRTSMAYLSSTWISLTTR